MEEDYLVSFFQRDAGLYLDSTQNLEKRYEIYLEKLTRNELNAEIDNMLQHSLFKTNNEKIKSYVIWKILDKLIEKFYTKAEAEKFLAALIIHKGDKRFVRKILILFGLLMDNHKESLVEKLHLITKYSIYQNITRSIEKISDGRRLGYFDFFLQNKISELEKNIKLKYDYSLKLKLDIHLKIQKDRRLYTSRLPIPPNTVDELKFILEEAQREHLFYPQPSINQINLLLAEVDKWQWDHPKINQNKYKIGATDIGIFFEHFLNTGLISYISYFFLRNDITIPINRLRAHHFKKTWIQTMHIFNKIYDKLRVLNNEIPYEGSLLEKDTLEMKKALENSPVNRMATVGFITAAAVAAAPIAAAIVRLVIIPALTQIGTRYVMAKGLITAGSIEIIATFGAYGFSASAITHLGRSAYVFYLQNAITINQTIIVGSEILLDWDTGAFSPGTSPSDLFSEMISNGVKEARFAIVESHSSYFEISSNIKIVDNKTYLPQVSKTKITEKTYNETFGGGKKIILISSEKNISPTPSITRQERGLPDITPSPPTSDMQPVPPPTSARLIDKQEKPTKSDTVRLETVFDGKRPVKYNGYKSWRSDVYIGTSTKYYRKNVSKLIDKDSNHPLRKLLGKNRMLQSPSKNAKLDEKLMHPEWVEMGHVRSKNAGGEEIIFLQTSYHNQRMGHDFERKGHVLAEELLDIGGIAVHPLSAWEWVERGILDKSVYENANKIQIAK